MKGFLWLLLLVSSVVAQAPKHKIAKAILSFSTKPKTNPQEFNSVPRETPFDIPYAFGKQVIIPGPMSFKKDWVASVQLYRLTEQSSTAVAEDALPIACCLFDSLNESAKYEEVILRKQAVIEDIENPGIYDQVKCWGNKEKGWCEKSRNPANYIV